MSCSTTSLLAGTITTNTLTIEDPYIFTETVPTTPPTLFSNSQKSRSRFELKPQQQSLGAGTQAIGATIPLRTTAQLAVNKDNLYVKGRNYGAQTQTSSITTATGTNFSKSTTTQTNANPPAAVLGVLNTNNIKKYETKTSKLLQQPPQRQQKHAQNTFAAQNENIIEKQLQQPKLLSTTPPPLLLSHTPSLWQTPLLLENTTTTAPATLVVKKEPTIRLHTIQASPQPPTPSLTATALVTPAATVSAAVPAIASTATVNTVATSVNGNIAPLHLLIPSAAPLPPSNFHHTTLAQHLQKLQCLKKPKKSNAQIALPVPTPALATSSVSPTLTDVKDKSNQQHSATDLNEIPVNVIFRAASTSTASQATQAQIGVNIETPAEKESTKPTLITRPSDLLCSNKRQKFSTPKQRKVQKTIVSKTAATVTTIPGATPSVPSNNPSKNIIKKKVSAKQRQPNVPLPPHPKTQKRFRKTNVFPSLLNERERVALAMMPDISLSTKAVAIIKRPYNELPKDGTTLTDDNELPFCVQKHWFTIQHDPILSGGLSREERITEYKSVLRRQAMQLLATRSLQRLPFNIARKRLICVDTLLRKYRDNNKSSSVPSKHCEIEFCKNTALAMTTICQQHMVKNSKQSIFVMCSAKNVENNSPQTTCNVPVLNIQKQYAPPLCYQHQSQQQQQQRPNYAANGKAYEPKINTSKVSWTNFARSTTTSATRKRKVSSSVNNAVSESNTMKIEDTLQLVSRTNMKRKNSTTSLESIASNSHSSFGSAVKTSSAALPMLTSFGASNMLSPPALAPLSYSSSQNNLPQLNERQNRSFPASTIDPVAEQEINKLVAQFAMAAAAKSATAQGNSCSNNNAGNNNNNNNFNSFNFMNTNSNSNLTSSGVGSSSSLPSTDELLTQDMLSNCENSSAYASSSEDTGLGELSESELMAVSNIANNIAVNAIVNGFSNIVSVEGSVGAVGGGGPAAAGGSGAVGNSGGGFNDDDVGPDEIPLGDARLLEENDLVNVFDTLPVNLNELFNSVVQQDEREEIERALEIADKHLRTLQQSIGSETDFLADLLDVNDMFADTDDICSKMEIVSSVLPPNDSLEAAALYLDNTEKVLCNAGGGSAGCATSNSGTTHHQVATANITMPTNCAGNSSANNAGVMDIRGLLQT